MYMWRVLIISNLFWNTFKKIIFQAKKKIVGSYLEFVETFCEIRNFIQKYFFAILR